MWAKQNRSLGQIWLKGCHSAVDRLWDNNSQCLWSACGHPGQETKCLPRLSMLSAWQPTKWVSFPSLFCAGGSRLSGLRGWLRALTRSGRTKIKPKEPGPESQLISSLSFVAWHWVKYIAGNQSYPSEGKKLVFYLCRSNNLYPKCLGQRCLFGTLRQPLTA